MAGKHHLSIGYGQHGMSTLIPRLARLPVKVTCRPVVTGRTYTTDPPRYRLYTDWTWALRWDFHASEPIQKVQLLFRADSVIWSRRTRRDARLVVSHSLSVSPVNPKQPDDPEFNVVVPLGGLSVVDPTLNKAAPQRVLDTALIVRHLACDLTIHTGTVTVTRCRSRATMCNDPASCSSRPVTRPMRAIAVGACARALSGECPQHSPSCNTDEGGEPPSWTTRTTLAAS